MKAFRFFFRFTKDQQKGIMALFVLIIVFQLLYFVATSFDFTSEKEQSANEKEWLAHQDEINALKGKVSHKDTVYPFNPNYISDYKGYLLGLSAEQIDRLHAYRESGKFVNSSSDFKKVTGVHDALLHKLEPYFKFGYKPERYDAVMALKPTPETKSAAKQTDVKLIDINQAVEEDLVKVYGIGPYYAKEILKRRSTFGGFVSMEQMDDFGAISSEAKVGLKARFAVLRQPEVDRLNVNNASLLQLSRFPYFNKDIARNIITQRSMDGKIKKIDDLLEIPNFPVDKVKIIALYLEF